MDQVSLSATLRSSGAPDRGGNTTPGMREGGGYLQDQRGQAQCGTPAGGIAESRLQEVYLVYSQSAPSERYKVAQLQMSNPNRPTVHRDFGHDQRGPRAQYAEFLKEKDGVETTDADGLSTATTSDESSKLVVMVRDLSRIFICSHIQSSTVCAIKSIQPYATRVRIHSACSSTATRSPQPYTSISITSIQIH